MFELWQSFSDDGLSVCPQFHGDDDTECGAPVKRVFGKVGISFKGDGFYKNDHGDAASNRRTESSTESSSSKSSSDSSSMSSDNGSSSSSISTTTTD